ncbi:hypothetical protein STIAU_6771 [Stigmatella aurantiaca DW4/3-1]|uniref:Uncharacterized protein n=1 Tax=Stigmatella aurantiaca (strain DW4/3-1) TaxID=378806 RepID=Q08XD3_STIAD|nr:hypothetical protein STIAU_6771 [Stigmatella aurantiaca DW4/3-1]
MLRSGRAGQQGGLHLRGRIAVGGRARRLRSHGRDHGLWDGAPAGHRAREPSGPRQVLGARTRGGKGLPGAGPVLHLRGGDSLHGQGSAARHSDLHDRRRHHRGAVDVLQRAADGPARGPVRAADPQRGQPRAALPALDPRGLADGLLRLRLHQAWPDRDARHPLERGRRPVGTPPLPEKKPREARGFLLQTPSGRSADADGVGDDDEAFGGPAADLHRVPPSREVPGAQRVPLAAIHLLVHLHRGQLRARGVGDDEGRRRGAVGSRDPVGVDRPGTRRGQVEREGHRVGDRLGRGVVVVGAVVARRGGRGDPTRGASELGHRRVVVGVVGVHGDGGRGLTAAAAVAALGLDLADVARPRPVGTRIRAVVRLEPAVRHDVVAVPGDPLPLRDVARELGRGGDLPGGEARLAGEAAVLDAHREVVHRGAVQAAVRVAVEAAAVGGRHVPGAVRLGHELGNLAAAFVHHVVGGGARGRVRQPAPAARVGALTRVDDDHRDVRARGARVVVGRRPPDGGPVVRRLGAQRGQRELRLHLGGHDGGGHRALGALGHHALAQGGEHLVVHVLGLRVRVGDAAEAHHRRRPAAQVRPVHLQRLGLGRQQRRARAEVGQHVRARLLRGDARQGRAALQPLAPQRHHAEGRGHPLELRFAAHHLPARLGEGDGLEQIRRHVELAGGLLEQRIQPARGAAVGSLAGRLGEGAAGGALRALRALRGLGATGSQGQGDGGRRERVAHRIHEHSFNEVDEDFSGSALDLEGAGGVH